MLRTRAAVTVLTLACSAFAQDAAPPPQPRHLWGMPSVEAVREAVRTGDSARLESLAAVEIDDTWLTAEWLWIAGDDDVLATFLDVLDRGPETASLRPYIEGKDVADRAGEAARLDRLQGAEARTSSRDPAGALAILEEISIDSDTVLSARVLRGRGNVLWSLQRVAEAAGVYEQASEKAGAIGDHYHAARSCRGSAIGYMNVGRLPDALRVRESSILHAEQADDNRLLGDLLTGLSVVCELTGDLGRARDIAARAVAHLHDTAPDSGEAVHALTQAGRVSKHFAEYANAVSVLDQALELARARKDPGLVGLVLSNLGSVHYARGDLDAAYETAVEDLALKRAGGRAASIADAESSLGWCRFLRGEWTVGLNMVEDALERARGVGQPHLLAGCLRNVAAACLQLGRFERALALTREARDLYATMGIEQGRIDMMHTAGNVLERMEQFDEARAEFTAARDAATAAGDAQRAGRAHGSLASLLERAGQLDEALAGHTEVHESARATGDVDTQIVAMTRIAEVLRAQGRHQDGLEWAQRALAMTREPGRAQRLTTALWAVASSQSECGLHDEALATAREAASHQLAKMAALTGEEGASARSADGSRLGLGPLIAFRAGDAAATLEMAETVRAGALAEALNQGGTLELVDVPTNLRNAEADATARLARARQELQAAQDSKKLKAVRDATAAVVASETALQEASERIRRHAVVTTGVSRPEFPDEATIRASLGPGQVLVTYVDVQDAYAAVVTTREGHRLVELATPDSFAAAIEGIREVDRADAPGAAIAAARRVLIAPLGLTESAREILLSTDGDLAYVAPSLLLPDRPVTCVPSASVRALLQSRASGDATDVLALGDPLYGLEKPTTAVAALRGAALRTGSLAPLPGTRPEVEAVGTIRLLGEDATETGLRAALEKHAGSRLRALHLACHGIVDERSPMFSALAVTPGGGDDGFLTALEVNRLPLDADLVTLSACDTARGKVYRGEGVVGLTSAFLVAGARSVICSLWKVDDEATRELMTHFYASWNPADGDGIPAAEALRRAQEHVRAQEQWSHPRFWAAWQIWGVGE